MTVVSPKKHSDAERVADISRRLMEPVSFSVYGG